MIIFSPTSFVRKDDNETRHGRRGEAVTGCDASREGRTPECLLRREMRLDERKGGMGNAFRCCAGEIFVWGLLSSFRALTDDDKE